MKPLHVAWLLEDTQIGGGARVVLAQADALIGRGHQATIVTRGQSVTWRSTRARWQYVKEWDEADVSSCDFVVATFWTTIRPALAMAGGRALHLCQGYEGSFAAYSTIKGQIDEAYRLPVPKLTVSPHLVPLLQELNADVTYIGQIVDDEFFQQPSDREFVEPRILLSGPVLKGVGIGYDAIVAARRLGLACDLVRVSPVPPDVDEPAHLAAEFRVALNTRDMAQLIASCDIALCPTLPQEGFGLPAAEAMASGLPVVLTSIPSYVSFDKEHDYAIFVSHDPNAMAAALMRLGHDESLRRQTASRGRQVAEQFRSALTGERLERFLARRR